MWGYLIRQRLNDHTHQRQHRWGPSLWLLLTTYHVKKFLPNFEDNFVLLLLLVVCGDCGGCDGCGGRHKHLVNCAVSTNLYAYWVIFILWYECISKHTKRMRVSKSFLLSIPLSHPLRVLNRASEYNVS